MERKYYVAAAGLLLALNVFAWREVFVLNQPGILLVNFMDVGQGDAAFIETPQNHQIVIDGGPDNSSVGKISAQMPFWDKEIDVIILTHPEKDHMQGLLQLLQMYRADYILWSGVLKNAPEYDAWLDVLKKQKAMGSKIIAVKAGDKVKLGDVIIDILFPLENLTGKEMKKSSNESCVVAKIIYGKNSFLFTGDIGAKEEKALAGYSGLSDLKSSVLKIAHHGSKYSSSNEFLAGVSPWLAAISVGKNSYGHPTQETLQRLENSGINVKRTDERGDIMLTSDGKNIYQ